MKGGAMTAETVSGRLSGPQWLLAILVAAAIGGAPVAYKAATAPAPVEEHAALQRIEGKLDAQARELATVRESVAEIRGELRARKAPAE